MKIYEGKRSSEDPFSRSVTVRDSESGESRPLDPAPSQKVWNHSPDGFEWGYGGSGPAQLALAILLDVTGDREEAVAHHQKFKWNVVAGLPKDEWRISEQEVKELLEAYEQNSY